MLAVHSNHSNIMLYMYFCVCKARMIDTVAGLTHPTFDVVVHA